MNKRRSLVNPVDDITLNMPFYERNQRHSSQLLVDISYIRCVEEAHMQSALAFWHKI